MALNSEQRQRVDSLIYGEYVDEDDTEKTDFAYQELMGAITDPEELHEYANAYNWSDGTGQLRAIIAHPLCDLGTALLIYWMGGPNRYLPYHDRSEVAEHDREIFELLAEIEQKVLAGDFQTRTQPFNPRNDQGTDWTTNYQDVLDNLRKIGKGPTRVIPQIMYEEI